LLAPQHGAGTWAERDAHAGSLAAAAAAEAEEAEAPGAGSLQVRGAGNAYPR